MTIQELNDKIWTKDELQTLCNTVTKALGYRRVTVDIMARESYDGRRAEYCRRTRNIRMFPRSMQPGTVFLPGTIRTLTHEIAHQKSSRHGVWFRKAHAKVFVWVLTYLGVGADEVDSCRISALNTVSFSLRVVRRAACQSR